MNWQLWIVFVFMVFSGVSAFSGIGEKRGEKTIELAFAGCLLTVILLLLFVWGVTDLRSAG